MSDKKTAHPAVEAARSAIQKARSAREDLRCVIREMTARRDELNTEIEQAQSLLAEMED